MSPSPSGRPSLASALLGIGRHQARAEHRRRDSLRRSRRAMSERLARTRREDPVEKALEQVRQKERERRARVAIVHERNLELHARSRWVLAVPVFLVTAVVLAFYAVTWDSDNRALDEHGRTVHARVVDHGKGHLSVLYPLDGRRLLFDIDEPADQQADREWVQERWEDGRPAWVKIDFLPDRPAVAVPHGERAPSGIAAAGAGVSLLLALLAFRRHVRVSKSYPESPEGENLFRRSRGGLWGVRGWILGCYSIGLTFIALFGTSPTDPVVDPRYTDGQVVDYWRCSQREDCYDGKVGFEVDDVHYEIEFVNVPPALGATVEVGYPEADPSQAWLEDVYKEYAPGLGVEARLAWLFLA